MSNAFFTFFAGSHAGGQASTGACFPGSHAFFKALSRPLERNVIPQGHIHLPLAAPEDRHRLEAAKSKADEDCGRDISREFLPLAEKLPRIRLLRRIDGHDAPRGIQAPKLHRADGFAERSHRHLGGAVRRIVEQAQPDSPVAERQTGEHEDIGGFARDLPKLGAPLGEQPLLVRFGKALRRRFKNAGRQHGEHAPGRGPIIFCPYGTGCHKRHGEREDGDEETLQQRGMRTHGRYLLAAGSRGRWPPAGSMGWPGVVSARRLLNGAPQWEKLGHDSASALRS